MIETILESALALICFVLVIIIMYTLVRLGVQEIIEAVKPVVEPEEEQPCQSEDDQDTLRLARLK